MHAAEYLDDDDKHSTVIKVLCTGLQPDSLDDMKAKKQVAFDSKIQTKTATWHSWHNFEMQLDRQQ